MLFSFFHVFRFISLTKKRLATPTTKRKTFTFPDRDSISKSAVIWAIRRFLNKLEPSRTASKAEIQWQKWRKQLVENPCFWLQKVAPERNVLQFNYHLSRLLENQNYVKMTLIVEWNSVTLCTKIVQDQNFNKNILIFDHEVSFPLTKIIEKKLGIHSS